MDTLGPLHELPTKSLEGLVTSLRNGPLSAAISLMPLEQLAAGRGTTLLACLERLQSTGFSARQMSFVVDAIVDTRKRAFDPSVVLKLVMSGPDVPGIPTQDTGAVMHTLIERAEREILLVGYAIHQGKHIFARLADRLDSNPALRVRLCLNIERKPTDTSLAGEITKRFLNQFQEQHWPGKRLPEIFFDPRALAAVPEERASLHAKCVAIDRKAALITSANFTGAALTKNVEVGTLIEFPPVIERLASYFDGLIDSGQLARLA
jgi:hypothetical protein